jgi:hypothetical protein
VTDTKAVQRLFDTLAGEYDQQLPFFATFGRGLVAWCRPQPGQQFLDLAAGRPGRPLPQICADTGFTCIEQRTARSIFTLRSPQHYWDWSMSHGFRGYVDSLGPELGAEFRARMLAGLAQVQTDDGIPIHSAVDFHRMRKA